jgi:hypothetical protein
MKEIVVPYEIAKIIRNVFLPQNPNKLRGAHPDTVAAAKYFIDALAKVSTTK